MQVDVCCNGRYCKECCNETCQMGGFKQSNTCCKAEKSIATQPVEQTGCVAMPDCNTTCGADRLRCNAGLQHYITVNSTTGCNSSYRTLLQRSYTYSSVCKENTKQSRVSRNSVLKSGPRTAKSLATELDWYQLQPDCSWWSWGWVISSIKNQLQTSHSQSLLRPVEGHWLVTN